jgi:hypothetical protein
VLLTGEEGGFAVAVALEFALVAAAIGLVEDGEAVDGFAENGEAVDGLADDGETFVGLLLGFFDGFRRFLCWLDSCCFWRKHRSQSWSKRPHN